MLEEYRSAKKEFILVDLYNSYGNNSLRPPLSLISSHLILNKIKLCLCTYTNIHHCSTAIIFLLGFAALPREDFHNCVSWKWNTKGEWGAAMKQGKVCLFKLPVKTLRYHSYNHRCIFLSLVLDKVVTLHTFLVWDWYDDNISIIGMIQICAPGKVKSFQSRDALKDITQSLIIRSHDIWFGWLPASFAK